MTGSRQVAKPAHCRPLPAGRGQTIAKNPANIYHSQIVQMGGSRIMRRPDFLYTDCVGPCALAVGERWLPAAVGTAPLNRWNFKLPA